MTTNREGGLLQWQYSLYGENHTRRATLVVHLLTVPLFWAGTLALLSSPWTGWPSAVLGPVTLLLVMALQGRAHAKEAVPPVPFTGPADVLARIFLEQWVTFPRFVLSGGLPRAWRATHR